MLGLEEGEGASGYGATDFGGPKGLYLRRSESPGQPGPRSVPPPPAMWFHPEQGDVLPCDAGSYPGGLDRGIRSQPPAE